MTEIKIRKNVPMPEAVKKTRYSKWIKVGDRMSIGDSVVLENRNMAMSLKNACERLGKKAQIVTLGEDQFGVWIIGEEEL